MRVLKLLLVTSSLLMINHSCSLLGDRCDNGFFYQSNDVRVKKIFIGAKDSSVYIVYSVPPETLYASPGISVIETHNNMPSAIAVYRMRIGRNDCFYDYKSSVGRVFKADHPELVDVSISDYNYVVCIPFNNLITKDRSAIDCPNNNILYLKKAVRNIKSPANDG